MVYWKHKVSNYNFEYGVDKFMIYVIADIHGCYDEYIALLKKINFDDEDELFILGDVVDRGPEPIKVLQDMMMRPNVYPILGNHDYMALKVLKKMCVEISEDNVETHLSQDDMMDYLYWMQDGGQSTVDKFRRLSVEEKEDILEYLQEFTLYEDIRAGGKRFILAHADLHGYDEGMINVIHDSEVASKSELAAESAFALKSEYDLSELLDNLDFSDFIFHRADYNRRYFKNKNTFLVTGHTPTFSVREDGEAYVYELNGHIAIDCGCVYGRKLAAYCLNDGSTIYVSKSE